MHLKCLALINHVQTVGSFLAQVLVYSSDWAVLYGFWRYDQHIQYYYLTENITSNTTLRVEWKQNCLLSFRFADKL